MYEQSRDEDRRRRSPSRQVRSTQLTRSGATRTRGQQAGRAQGDRQGRPTAAWRSASAPASRERAQARRPQESRGLPRVPLILAILMLVAGAAAGVLVTRLVMKPQVEAARQEVKDLRSELATAKQEVDRYKETERVNASTSDSAGSEAATGVESPWTSSGTFTTGDATLDTEVKEYVDSHVTSGSSREDGALEMYTSIAWSDYVERDDAQHPSGENWRIEYARKYYEHDCSGNCYEFASFLMYCMRYMGYEDALAEGVEIEFEGGNWGDHGIVFVTNTDGTPSLLDTARGTDGWMLGKDVYNYKIMDLENA